MEEFALFLRGMGLIPDNREVQEVFQAIDTNRDGNIEFDEFLHVSSTLSARFIQNYF